MSKSSNDSLVATFIQYEHTDFPNYKILLQEIEKEPRMAGMSSVQIISITEVSKSDVEKLAFGK